MWISPFSPPFPAPYLCIRTLLYPPGWPETHSLLPMTLMPGLSFSLVKYTLGLSAHKQMGFAEPHHCLLVGTNPEDPSGPSLCWLNCGPCPPLWPSRGPSSAGAILGTSL